MKITKKKKKIYHDFSIPKKIITAIELNGLQFKKLSIGRTSSSMDEKWNDFFEDGFIRCYRSWTGHIIFQAKLIQENETSFLIKEFIVETDPEKFNIQSEEGLKQMFNEHISYLANREIRNAIEDALLGFITADAVGVPVEFKSRAYLQENPVTDMIGFGTYNQPPGTWSDDSTMTLCLAESLLDDEFSLTKLANRFINWVDWGYWTPYDELFDIGFTTQAAIERMRSIEDVSLAGGKDEFNNGNGSLMRILPMMFENYDERDHALRYDSIKEVASLTHAHERSVLACFYYLTFARFLRDNYYPPIEMYKLTNTVFKQFVISQNIDPKEIKHFDRLLDNAIQELDESEIKSSGYVIDTLEASIWCFLTTKNYKDAVLKAVNLGEDTDTVAAVAGGLAGLQYGKNQIPEKWINQLAKLTEINDLIDRLSVKYGEVRI